MVDIANHHKVLLPLIRNAMPNIIANDIIGVQPMTGPVGDIFTMGIKYMPIALGGDYYTSWMFKIMPWLTRTRISAATTEISSRLAWKVIGMNITATDLTLGEELL